MSEQTHDEPRPLEFATTQELWDEFSTRFEGCLVAFTRKPRGINQTDISQCGVLFTGGFTGALGLSEFARMWLKKWGDVEMPPTDSDDSE